MRKVDLHLRLFREEAVLTHFAFLVVREGGGGAEPAVSAVRAHEYRPHAMAEPCAQSHETLHHLRQWLRECRASAYQPRLGTCSWFCEPYHSWEHGTVENTLGLVRRFFPKKTDVATISKNEILSVERWLNNRPRKCLGLKTPAEVFKAAGVALAG